jgi:hypothetical protein
MTNQEKSTPVLGFPFTFKSTGSLENFCTVCGISAFDHLHEAGKSPKEFVRLTTDSHSVQEVNKSMEDRFDYKMDEIMMAWEKQEFVYDLRNGLKDFIRSELALQRKQILDILVDEINIANTHNQPTMRITSAYNRIINL